MDLCKLIPFAEWNFCGIELVPVFIKWKLSFIKHRKASHVHGSSGEARRGIRLGKSLQSHLRRKEKRRNGMWTDGMVCAWRHCSRQWMTGNTLTSIRAAAVHNGWIYSSTKALLIPLLCRIRRRYRKARNGKLRCHPGRLHNIHQLQCTFIQISLASRSSCFGVMMLHLRLASFCDLRLPPRRAQEFFVPIIPSFEQPSFILLP